MKIWAKIEDNIIVYPPKNDTKTGTFNVDKNLRWLLANGFTLMTPLLFEPYMPKPVELPKRYSTLKIIRTLDTQWDYYRSLLEQAGYLDQFFAAAYIASDDPVFLDFINQVPLDYIGLLDSECLWTAD